MLEGTKLLGEAFASGVLVESVFVDPEGAAGDAELQVLLDRAIAAGVRVFDLAPGVLARVAETVNPQPVLAVAPMTDVPLATLLDAEPDLLVVCVDVRDPGNAGTVLRSAQAAGAGGVVCCDGSVDVFNPKTVRASAGALFHVPVVAGGESGAVLDELGARGVRRLGAVAHGGQDYAEGDYRGPVALVVGNEARGLPGDASSRLDGLLSIPMAGGAESLNVGMAAAVLCFEVARKRRLEGRPPPRPARTVS